MVRQVCLEITDDRAEKAGREKPRPEGTGRVLTNRWQLPQGGSGRRGHTAKLPVHLLGDSVRSVRRRQSGRLGGIRGSTEGVRAHVRNACGLAGRSRGGHRCGSAHLTSGATADEPSADLLCDAQLATGKGAGPGDGITGTGIPRSFRFEQSQHVLGAVRRPPSDDSPVGFTQCLRRIHTRMLPRVSALFLTCRIGRSWWSSNSPGRSR